MGSREGAAKARATFLARVRAGEIRVTGKAGASGVVLPMALPEGDIRSRNRSARVVTARSVACYRIRRELGASLPEIASLLRRDHTTVRDGVLRVEAAIARGDATVIWLACRRRAA